MWPVPHIQSGLLLEVCPRRVFVRFKLEKLPSLSSLLIIALHTSLR